MIKRNSLFRVTNIGYQVWGVLVGWNPEWKIPVPWSSIPKNLHPDIKPGTR